MTYRPGGDIVEHKTDQLFCVVAGTWKYIQHRQREAEGELYDLAADPDELRNLYATRPDVVRRLQADLGSRDYVPAPARSAGGISPADAERLRSLGYTR
ncbi:DUF4976 domain-containing protein [bacterium]|nr:DUF4976 domain-containing protein [bacterium]